MLDSQMPNEHEKNSHDDEIDLSEVLAAIYKDKLTIMLFAVLFAFTSIVFSLFQSNVYRSEALLSPSSDAQSGGLSSLAGQLGGLANIAGFDLGGNSSANKTQLAIEVMKSRKFIAKFVNKHNILPELIAATDWKQANGEVVYDTDLYDPKLGRWVREPVTPYDKVPSEQEAYKKFKELFSVSLDTESGLVKVAIEHYSPKLAHDWVTWIVKDINQEMKEQDVSEARESINYLYEKISETPVNDIKKVLHNLVEEQEKTIMFSEVRKEYIFKTIDPAIIPEEKVGPKRALIVILGCIFGFVIGIGFVLVRHFLAKQKLAL
ncbi:Wzz/FepE/Etk N-terminal domain-containing protein [Pseudoalteromonas prydzensis]|uniref:Wzz/FepE/Etk N-terminal domain-containing protein n=1 Tax=Pseudoalteromonas prydzensis TaxID=182141 RepID=UPI003FD58C11